MSTALDRIDSHCRCYTAVSNVVAYIEFRGPVNSAAMRLVSDNSLCPSFLQSSVLWSHMHHGSIVLKSRREIDTYSRNPR